MTPLALSMIIFAYLLGSISSAVLICRVLRLPDPRNVGSQNPGATNVLRIGGKKAAVAVLLCDMLKGTIPVWGGYFLNIEPFMLGLVAIAACLGHMYPIFFHFKGGKRRGNRVRCNRTDWARFNRYGDGHMACRCRTVSLLVACSLSHCVARAPLHLAD